MSSETRQTSLDNLARIANMTHELKIFNQQVKTESPNSYNSLNSRENTQNSGNGNNKMISKKGKPKRIACVECRQQKSRCDAHEKLPAPCSRCAKKGFKCDLKTDYKRTYKRARIAQIEREFSELKKTITATQAAELLNKVPTLSNGIHKLEQTSQGIHGYQGSQRLQRLQGLQIHGIPKTQIQIQSQKHNNNAFNQISYMTHHQQPSQLNHQQLNNVNNNQQSWNSSMPSYHYDTKILHYSSESNNSIIDTPSIYRSLDIYSKQESESIKIRIPDDSLNCTEKALDSIILSPDLIRKLYLEYVDCYHSILPVVDVLKGPERIYKLCPVLFWVIMLIALRRFGSNSEKILLLQLSKVIKHILAEITISPITRYNPTEEDEPILNVCSVYSVQAFLLYTFWPPITSSLSADSSWNTIGVALFQAIRIGLHTPSMKLKIDGTKSPQQLEIAQEQTKTWVICNIVSQKIATSFGLPAFVQFDSSVCAACRLGNEFNIPRSIQFMMEIAHFEDQVAKTLNSNQMDIYGLIDPTERLPLLKVLLRQLDELEIKLSDELSTDYGFKEFQLLSARVHLLTYYFMDSSRIADFELQKGLVRLFNAAVSLINHAETCQDKNKIFVKYLPSVYILNIWQASCIIVKLAHSPLKEFIDSGAGKQSYQAAISLAAKASILKHDIAYRSSGIMRNMWQLFRTLDEKKSSSLSINIRTRMAASVFFDCLYLLREQVGMIKLNSKTDENNDNLEGDDNETGSYDDDDEYGFQENENSTVSDDENHSIDESQNDQISQKSTPGSNKSSKSSKSRKQRTLLNTVDAESRARKIIRTIPLDPRPISVSGKRSSIFKVVNNSNDCSPQLKSEKDSSANTNIIHNKLYYFSNKQFTSSTNDSLKYAQISPSSQQRGCISHSNFQQHNYNDTLSLPLAKDNNINKPSANKFDLNNKIDIIPYSDNCPINNNASIANKASPTAITTTNNNNNIDLTLSDIIINESPAQVCLNNLETDCLDMNSEILWKDIDSVMNDFGFHTQ